jgi:cold shock CspA family protein
MGFIPKQPKHRGVCILSRFNSDWSDGFGFIEPEGTNGDRSQNVWFGPRATEERPVERGDIVDFIYRAGRQSDKGPSAFRVWVRKQAVEGDENA